MFGEFSTEMSASKSSECYIQTREDRESELSFNSAWCTGKSATLTWQQRRLRFYAFVFISMCVIDLIVSFDRGERNLFLLPSYVLYRRPPESALASRISRRSGVFVSLESVYFFALLRVSFCVSLSVSVCPVMTFTISSIRNGFSLCAEYLEDN